MSLEQLEQELSAELHLLSYPPPPWLLPADSTAYDVAIIGSGMAGLAVALALRRLGILRLVLLDSYPAGLEGPWANYARMLTLRSGKKLVGPALDIPKLTFEAWYTAQYGQEGWQQLYKIPTLLWMDYLRWYRHVLELPVYNDCAVTHLKPAPHGGLELTTTPGTKVVARKVVLATGRAGFGGPRYPSFVQGWPKELYAHTSEKLDFSQWYGQHVCILGAGASACDAAAVALEEGAARVTMLLRRPKLPAINKAIGTIAAGFSHGFYQLPDQAKVAFMQHIWQAGGPPPFESLDRLRSYPNFRLLCGVAIVQSSIHAAGLTLTLSDGSELECQFLILATGFATEGASQPELAAIYADIALWGDRYPDLAKPLSLYPYLGTHFQFQAKQARAASYLQDLYCFNYAAALSHGLTSSDIPDISVGATRLAQGIAADFFVQHWPDYFQRLQEYQMPEFLASDYPFISDE